MAYTSKMKRWRSPAPVSVSSVSAMRTRSSNFTPATSAACSGSANARSSNSLEAILEPRGPERGAGAPRGMALHVHRHRVHGDVRGRGFYVHGEGGRVAAQALRPDAEQIHRLAQLALALR